MVNIVDFDGDATGVMFLLDEVANKAAATLQPHYSVFDMDKPRSVSSVMSIPKPVIANINNWYYTPDVNVNQSLMEQFLV